MLIKTPAELVKRLNELRQQNPLGYAHLKFYGKDQQDSGEDNQPLPGDQDDD